MNMNLKKAITETAEFYERHAAWQWDKAKTAQSETAKGIMERAARYNEGRAAAMREVIDLINRFIG